MGVKVLVEFCKAASSHNDKPHLAAAFGSLWMVLEQGGDLTTTEPPQAYARARSRHRWVEHGLEAHSASAMNSRPAAAQGGATSAAAPGGVDGFPGAGRRQDL